MSRCGSCGRELSGPHPARCPECGPPGPEGPGPDPQVGFPLSEAFRAEYRIERRLGGGAMGAVYLATRVSTGRSVAVKFLMETSSPVSRRRFVREGQMMAQIDHPNVVRVYDAGETGGRPYLVSEYVTHGSLKDLLDRKKRLPAAEAVRCALDILAGLEACHNRGILHRDVKPANILIDPEGRAKIADLGIAKDTTGDGTLLTRTGTRLGTPIYMSPEMVRGEPAQIGSDLYSVGVILHEMVAGEPPFDAESVAEIFEMHVRAAPPPLDSTVPDLPQGLSDVVLGALEKNVRDRPASAAVLAASLRRVARGRVSRPLSGARSVSSSAAPASGRVRAGRMVVCAVAACALGALGVTLGARCRPAERPVAAPAPATQPPSPSVTSADTILADEIRQLREREEQRTFTLRRFYPEGVSGDDCPVVVTCPGHVVGVAIAPGPDTVVSHPVFGRAVADRMLTLEESGLAQGLNWVRVSSTTGRPAATIRLHRSPCPAGIPTARAWPRGIELCRRTDEILEIHHVAIDEATARSLLASAVATVPRAAAEAAVARLLTIRGEPVAWAVEHFDQMTDDPVSTDPQRLAVAHRMIDTFQRAIADDPERWDPWQDLADALHRVGQDEAARVAAVHALTIWPRAEWSWGVLGLIERRAYLTLSRRATSPALAESHRLEAVRFLTRARSCVTEREGPRGSLAQFEVWLRELRSRAVRPGN